MSALRELQIGFAASLTNREAAARFAPGVRAQGIAAERRLQVYRNNLFAGLAEVLAAVYPVTRRLVGEAYFNQAARAYIAGHPSPSGDVHRYGGHFAAHLGRCPGGETLGYLPDVAHLEWGYHRAFHAEQHPALDAGGLRAVQPQDYPRLRLMLQPSARLLESGYPVLRIWQVNQPDWTGDATVRLTEGRARLLILRQGVEVAFVPLGAGEHLWLQGLAHGLTLLEAQQRAAVREPDFDLGAALQRLLAQGAFSGWQA
jgi:Putative DNA-binding domain